VSLALIHLGEALQLGAADSETSKTQHSTKSKRFLCPPALPFYILGTQSAIFDAWTLESRENVSPNLALAEWNKSHVSMFLVATIKMPTTAEFYPITIMCRVLCTNSN